jgi:hypothetical protein
MLPSGKKGLAAAKDRDHCGNQVISGQLRCAGFVSNSRRQFSCLAEPRHFTAPAHVNMDETLAPDRRTSVGKCLVGEGRMHLGGW